MKKISLFTATMFAGLIALGQDQSPNLKTEMDSKVRFGLKAGATLPTVEADDDSPSSGNSFNTNMKTSLAGGFFVNIPISDHFRFQPEIVYSGQGSKITQKASIGGGSTSQTYELDMHYLTLPLTFQFQTHSGFWVETGPQFGYLIRAEQEGPGSQEINLEDMDYVKKTDFSWNGGIGYLFRVGLGINARYNFGFSNIWDNDNSSSPMRNFDFSNRVLSFNVVYHLGAHK